MTSLLLTTARETFKFLSSVKLAVTLLIAFSILLAYATIYESLTSIEEAQELVYRTAWFDFLLFLLGMNVLCSALSRLPWKKRHTGFVITHAGILIILLGSMVTRKAGVEGQLALFEGESASTIMLPQRVMAVSVPRLDILESLDPWFMENGIPEGKGVRYEIPGTDIVCYVEEYYHNPIQREYVTDEGLVDNPAVRITISRPGEDQLLGEQWLYANDPLNNALDMGIASIQFIRADSDDELAKLLETPEPSGQTVSPDAPQGWLSLQNEAGDEQFRLAVEELDREPQTFTYEGNEYTARLLNFFPRSTIEEGNLVNNPQGGINPAIRFSLVGPEGSENHLAFAMFPQFGSVHGERVSHSGLQAVFEYPMENQATTDNRFNLILGNQGTLHYMTRNAQGMATSGLVTPGKPIDTTWNNLELTVHRFIPRALVKTELLDRGADAPPPRNNPLMLARFVNNGDEQELYVPFNNPRRIRVGGEDVQVYFGQKQHPLGFSIELVDFRAPMYPGTNNPMRFESDVIYVDPKEGIQEETRIHMNHPLYHNGFAVYQSSYQPGENGQPDLSIFTVAFAPGTPIIYFGSIVMVTGMVLIFSSTKYGRRRAPRPADASS